MSDFDLGNAIPNRHRRQQCGEWLDQLGNFFRQDLAPLEISNESRRTFAEADDGLTFLCYPTCSETRTATVVPRICPQRRQPLLRGHAADPTQRIEQLLL